LFVGLRKCAAKNTGANNYDLGNYAMRLRGYIRGRSAEAGLAKIGGTLRTMSIDQMNIVRPEVRVPPRQQIIGVLALVSTLRKV